MSGASTPQRRARGSQLARRGPDAFDLELADGEEEGGGAPFHALFGLHPSEALIEDFACAISRSILLQGRMYITQHHVCFYSCLFGHRTAALLPFAEIGNIRKVTHALINPGIEISRVDGEAHSFASFFFRCAHLPVHLRAAAFGRLPSRTGCPDAPRPPSRSALRAAVTRRRHAHAAQRPHV